jgi:hypothetical protein
MNTLRLFMPHFGTVDEAGKVTKGLKVTLDKTNSKHGNTI